MPVQGIYPLEVGGAELYSYKLTINLSKLGHKISVFMPNCFGFHFGTKQINKNFRIFFFPYLIAKFLSGILFVIGVLLQFLTAIPKMGRVEVVHAHTAGYPMIAGFLLSKILRIPLIITCHGSDIITERNNIWLRCIQDYIFKRSNYVITVSNELKRILEKTLKNISIAVISGGVDKGFFKLKSKNMKDRTSYNILFVGSLRTLKNPKITLDALLKLKGYKYGLNLNIIGNGPLYDDLIEYCQKNQLNNVTFIKSISHKKIRQFYEDADLFLMPSLSEGTPLALIEAMASAKPIIASYVGGITDLIKNGHNGILIDPQNLTQLVEKIQFLIENSEFSKKIGMNARKTVLSRSWENICREYLEIYNKAIRSGNK
ncbi:MAG TPA: glycosyltransferase family 4 protein [Candidatus Deferrimicrobium sp.]|nr:glycosyltransferase family 4 protein [Candidatus Deferrimicrobium sp.]